jgi:hypothetical protein
LRTATPKTIEIIDNILIGFADSANQIMPIATANTVPKPHQTAYATPISMVLSARDKKTRSKLMNEKVKMEGYILVKLSDRFRKITAIALQMLAEIK